MHWRQWGEAALEEARREDKPVLLDIGAIWCHWCHVMDHESYEDEGTAALINERFVPVKVDRDERPDVDARYQKAVQAITGQGGWPLTAFLTPEGRVYYGGTYFPPEPAHGRPSFRQVLEAASEFYGEQRDDAVAQAKRIADAVAGRGGGQAGDVTQGTVDEAVETILAHHDPVNGGFGGAPKFPHPAAVDLLLHRHATTGRAAALQAATATLDAMARGGIHDHLGGGFHRYSVDARWIVPHFEKLAYDNAELLRAYAHGHQVTGSQHYRRVALGVVRWVDAVLSDQERGGFYGSQDADVGPHDDGDYWTWTLDEVRGALSHDEARLLALHFGVGERGEMQHDPARNVLHVENDAGALSAALGMAEDEVREALASAQAKLLRAREQREAPVVDETLFTNWNGMMANAYLEAHAALGEEHPREFALRSLERVHREAWAPDGGYAHAIGEGGASVRGLLDDHAQMLQAWVTAHHVTQDATHLQRARAVADLLLDEFWDDERGGLRDVAPRLHDGAGAAPLAEAERPFLDNPSPAPNPVAAMALDRLHLATGEARYRERAGDILAAFAGAGGGYGVHGATYYLATALHLNPPPRVLVVGDADHPRSRALRRAARAAFAPGAVVLQLAPDGGAYAPPSAEAMLERAAGEGGPVALVCAGDRCLAPTADPREARRRVVEALAGQQNA